MGPQDDGGSSSNLREGRDIVVEPCCIDEEEAASFSEADRDTVCRPVAPALPLDFSAWWFVSVDPFEACFTEDDTLRL